jgi:hypothetical protein
MQLLGFVHDLEPNATAQLPSLRSIRDQLDPAVVPAVVEYLQQGDIVSDALEIVSDPLDPTSAIAGGSGLQSDGTWVWRQDLWHYVQRYRIALPKDFVDHALRAVTVAPLSARQIYSAMDAHRALFGR